MSDLDLRLRNLETGELLVASFPHLVDAALWLRERPRMMEVLGVYAASLTPDDHYALKRVMRPLDDDEAAVVERMDAEAERLFAERQAEEARRAAEEAEAHRAAMRDADPNRPMEVAWTLEGGFERVDPADPREISADVQAAVRAWVRERDGWVADRGLVVGEAVLTVWPGVVPEGEERVLRGGRFTPVLKG